MSESKINASRENGSKSRGPKTPEGKQRSSQNAIKHGLCARRLVLPDESPADFDAMTVHWMRQLQPHTPAEREIVGQIVASAWLMRRYERAETSAFAIEMDKTPGDPEAIGHAVNSLAASRVLDLLLRYRTRARRDFEELLKTYAAQVNRRRNEQVRDECNMNEDDFENKWGIQPECYSVDYCGRPEDALPNEPDEPGIYAALFNTERPDAA